MKKYIYKIVLCLFLIYPNSFADVLNDISISGNSRISNNTIIDIIGFKKGSDYKIKDVNTFQKKLLETNFFQNVNLKLNNNVLEIIVTENPLVEFFVIQGIQNKEREDKVYEEITLGQNKIYSEYLLKQDLETIKTIFKNSGYINININPELSKLPNGNINLVLNISRGEKYKIKRIYFIGEKYFNSSTLSNVISSSEHGWWKFLSSSTDLNYLRVDFDKKLLKNFYINNGFFDVQILSSDIELIEEGYANITYSISSGKIYNFSKTVVSDKDNNLNKKELNIIKTYASDILKERYSKNKINNLRTKIKNYLDVRKIEFLKFSFLENKVESSLIDIQIVFEKDEKKFLNKIMVKGNSITEEEVIRRELLFSEGDTISKYNLDRSIDKLKATGIFKNVKSNVENIGDDMLDLTLEVEEQPTGAISAGVGVGSSGGSISSGITEKNLFGKGISIDSNIVLSTEFIKGNITTQIPDFNNSDNKFFYDIYARAIDYENAGYESTVVGNSLALQYDLFEDISLKPGIGIERDSIDTNAEASQLYKKREGDFLAFKTFYNITTDKRDRYFQTTKGYRVSFGQNFAIPGSDIPLLENNISGAYYYPVNKDYIFSIKSGLKTVNALNNKDVKLSDRQFLTSRNLRGFESFGIGPKDGKDHIGGNYSAYTSFSSTVPNFLPEKWNANSIVFIDTGNVWGVDYDSSKDSDKIRSSIGVGLDWVSPLGPLSFIFAQTLSSSEGDLEESFSFQLGSSF